MSQRYRLAPSARVSKTLSDLLYAASEVVATAAQYETTPAGQTKLAKMRGDLITESAGALVRKPPSAVLATLVWVVELAQARATENDFGNAQEALDEHDALAFVADWLEAEGVDVSDIRGAAPSAEALAELVARRDAEQEALDALERPVPLIASDKAYALAEVFGGLIPAALALGYEFHVRPDGLAPPHYVSRNGVPVAAYYADKEALALDTLAIHIDQAKEA
ncbi:hypothetical protein CcrSwift_gp339 [Caulobacter phage CcrSwift]|uniref:Uncharacterized protein n=1 Tax=Caulobacter phage CcrSwift TaxID=2927984 RepID=K4K6V4_9CAUD|nr:hypothetical protein D870_gp014 [Caulobacter phage CcrSwift]YP_006990072.1 hypothetical protein D870_gp082 [Caulobacter phage CcrSwift]AFU88332.1 hypothetical protein CcrSwift_gp014 [Caulobacter phage CcrSwift]AFU88657.1 hypothetical protein CcrSwift_gp339 [Caulobacter phage CcrSwift]